MCLWQIKSLLGLCIFVLWENAGWGKPLHWKPGAWGVKLDKAYQQIYFCLNQLVLYFTWSEASRRLYMLRNVSHAEWNQANLRMQVDEKMLYDTFSAFGVRAAEWWQECHCHWQRRDGWTSLVSFKQGPRSSCASLPVYYKGNARWLFMKVNFPALSILELCWGFQDRGIALRFALRHSLIRVIKRLDWGFPPMMHERNEHEHVSLGKR